MVSRRANLNPVFEWLSQMSKGLPSTQKRAHRCSEDEGTFSDDQWEVQHCTHSANPLLSAVVTLGGQAAPPLATQRHGDVSGARQGLAAGTPSSPEGAILEGEEGIEANFLPYCIAKTPSFQPSDCGIAPFPERR